MQFLKDGVWTVDLLHCFLLLLLSYYYYCYHHYYSFYYYYFFDKNLLVHVPNLELRSFYLIDK